MYCPKCGLENDEDSFFCKKCGFPLDEKPENFEKIKYKKGKTKVKTKKKTKVKYVDRNKEKGKMNLFQKFMMLFLILLSLSALGLAGFLGYYIYTNQNIIVPSVTGYSYEKACEILKNKKLQCAKIEKIVTDQNNAKIVINQSKKSGTKVIENTTIKLTVGVLDTSVLVPNVVGFNLNEAISILNKNNIKYKIVYSLSDEDNDTVINQNVKKGKKIKLTDTLIITVSKNNEEESNNEESNKTTKEDKISEEDKIGDSTSNDVSS